MASLSDQSRVRELFDRMTLGVVRSLEKRPGVSDVRLLDRQPAEKHILHTWEQKNMCILPEDLKSFYLTTNGLLIQWCIKFDGSVLPLGKMEVNPVAGMVALTKSQSSLNDEKPSLADLDTDDDEKDSQGHTKPHFDNRSKVFELDPCDGYGKICLVYKDVKAGVTTSKPEIWYLDRSLDWWFIADSFTDFFRIMIMHLGLPQWQYVFTDSGISPETKQWFNMYAPVRLEVDSDIQSMENNPRTSGMPVNTLDINRLFRGKSDKNRSKQTQARRPAAAKPQSRGSLGTRASQR